MPKRYTCRLYAVELPDGHIQVTYDDPPGNIIARPFDLIGPVPVQLPDRPLTRREYDEWEMRQIPPVGIYQMCISARRPCGLPPIEEEDIPDQAEMKVFVALGKQEVCDQDCLLATVSNVGSVDIPRLTVRWAAEYETPQPHPNVPVPCQAVGEELFLHPVPGNFNGVLPVGEQWEFVLHPEFVKAATSHAQSLSTERYKILVKSDQIEIYSIEGSIVGELIDTLEN